MPEAPRPAAVRVGGVANIYIFTPHPGSARMRFSTLLVVCALIALVAMIFQANSSPGIESSMGLQHATPSSSSTLGGGGHGILAAVEYDASLGADSDAVRAARFDKIRQQPSPKPSPPPPPLPVTATAAAISSSPCAAGCEVHGTCNRELGRCDCPALRSGKACELNAVPSCRRMWGMDLPTPPCQAFATEQWDYRDFPPTCECLAECQALNLRVVYVMQCVNASQTRYWATTEGWPPRTVGLGAKYPWRDPFADGKWLRQASPPMLRGGPPVDEAAVSKLNLELAARLNADGAKSVAKQSCSGRGILTLPMPWYGGRARSSGEVCHCFPGW